MYQYFSRFHFITIHKTLIERVLVAGILFLLTCIYFYPMFQGLMLLPLDLLVTNANPWNLLGTILVKNPFMQDSIVQMYPWKQVTFEALRHGTIPFWNPYQAMGAPFMASLKPMVFYPFTILLSFLHPVTAWNSLLFLQVFLAMFFAYLLARDLDIDVLPAILVSLAFSLNSLMMAVLEFGSEGHVLLWVPLILFSVKKYIDKKSGAALVVLGLSTAASILAGQLQYFSYGCMLLVAFTLWYGRQSHAKLTDYLRLFAAIGCGIGLSAIQLLPFFEMYQASYRAGAMGSKFFSEGLHMPFDLVRFLAPDIFGNPVKGDQTSNYIEHSGYFGSIALFFAVYAMSSLQKNRFVRFFTVVFWTSLLLSMKGIGDMLLFLHIPVLTSGSGNRILSLVYMSGAFLAGLGMTHFFGPSERKNKITALILFAIIMLAFLPQSIPFYNTFIGIYKKNSLNFQNIRFALMIAGAGMAIIGIFLTRKKQGFYITTLLSLAIVAIVFFDLFRMGYRFVTFSNKKFLYPEIPVVEFVKRASAPNLNRVYGLTEPEIATVLHVPMLESYNPLHLRRFHVFLDTLLKRPTDSEGLTSKLTLDANDGIAKKHVVDLLGVSLVVAPVNTDPSSRYFSSYSYQSRFTPVYKDPQYIVFQNLDAYPRFGLFYDAVFVKTDVLAMTFLHNQSLDMKKTVIIDTDTPMEMKSGTGSATLTSSDVNALSFSIKTNQPAFFYMSDTHFPGWHAWVNGKEEKIYRANYNFRAVWVPAGSSTLIFRYEPTTFRIGIGIGIASGILLLFLGLLPLPRRAV